MFGGRLAPPRTVGFLLAGDLAALSTFVAASAASHGGGLPGAVETAGQFGVGWVVAAAVLGAYGPRAASGARPGATYGAATWAVGAVIGALVRAATEPGAGLSAVFVGVTVGVGVVIFGCWRGIAGHVLGGP